MVFEVGGFNLLPYLTEDGFEVTREDGDGPNAGRSQDYTLWRDRRATKYAVDAKLKELDTETANLILPKLLPEFVTVRYTNPWLGGTVTQTMYSANNKAKVRASYDDVEIWDLDAVHFAQR